MENNTGHCFMKTFITAILLLSK